MHKISLDDLTAKPVKQTVKLTLEDLNFKLPRPQLTLEDLDITKFSEANSLAQEKRGRRKYGPAQSQSDCSEVDACHLIAPARPQLTLDDLDNVRLSVPMMRYDFDHELTHFDLEQVREVAKMTHNKY